MTPYPLDNPKTYSHLALPYITVQRDSGIPYEEEFVDLRQVFAKSSTWLPQVAGKILFPTNALLYVIIQMWWNNTGNKPMVKTKWVWKANNVGVKVFEWHPWMLPIETTAPVNILHLLPTEHSTLYQYHMTSFSCQLRLLFPWLSSQWLHAFIFKTLQSILVSKKLLCSIGTGYQLLTM